MIEETLAVQWRRLSNLWMGTLRSRPKLAPFELKKSVINEPLSVTSTSKLNSLSNVRR